MTKTKKIIYWISTLWLALGMISTAIVQLMKSKVEVDKMAHLGFPIYLLTIIGIWKILGVVAVLVPKFPLVKEWAYAGFFIAMSGAIISHLVCKDSPIELFGPTLLIVLTVVSWSSRPESRKFSNK